MKLPDTVTSHRAKKLFHGHHHFWQRALGRRQLLRTSASLTALGLTSGLWSAAEAAPADNPFPKPIPGGLVYNGQLIHVFFPAFGQEVSTITDFNGVVAAAEVQGTGTATDTSTGTTTQQFFDADMRFFQGMYVGTDGRTRQDTFGFV